MKKLFLTLAVAALGFTACDNNDRVAPTPPPSPQTVTITATGIGGTPFTGLTTVTALSGTTQVFAPQTLTGGTGFTLNLTGTPSAPALATMTTYFPNGTAPSGVTSNNADFRYLQLTFNGNNGTLINETVSGNTTTQWLYWYVDSDANVSGTDGSGTFDRAYSLTLKQGWNVVQRVTNSETNVITYTTVSTSPNNWVFTPTASQTLPLTAIQFTGTATDLNTIGAYANNGAVPVATATYTAGQNNFTITLPATAPGGATLAPFWANAGAVPAGIVISDVSAQYFQIDFRGFDATTPTPALEGFLVNQNAATAPTSQIVYWYVDRNVTITGSTTGTPPTIYNVRLTTGWNRVLRTTATGGTVTYTAPTSTTLSWFLNPAA